MTIKPAALLLLATCLLACAATALPAQAQRPRGQWTTSCSASHCTASTRVGTNEPGVPYAYQLRVSRYRDDKIELVLLTGSRRPADDAAIRVHVDDKALTQLTPGTGYRRVGASNTFVIAQADPLLQAMRRGRQLRLSFRTMSGAEETAALSLQGMDGALSAIGVSGGKTTAATPPATQAATPAGNPPAREAAARNATGKAAAAPKTGAKRTRSAADAPLPAPTAPVTAPTAPPSDTRMALQADGAELPAAVLDVAPSAPASPSASASSSSVAPTSPASVPRQFACQGNEPFWNLVIDGDTARYVSLAGGGEPAPVLLSGRLHATAGSTGTIYGWRGRAADGNAYGVLIERRSCRDDMSSEDGGLAFAYSATLAVPGRDTLHGCCNTGLTRVKGAEVTGEASVRLSALRTRSPDDWSRHLSDLLPAIDACLERTPGSGAYVTKAWPMNRGLVGVRTRNASVGWFECVAQREGRNVESFAPVDSKAEHVPDEEKVLFVPPSVARMEGTCFRHERVVDETDRLYGWLTTNSCWRTPVARRRN
ncbi:MAG: hypothetical protein KIS79_04400 [Burkholderiales bacterium]|nr:hypothetical protein [Burkholderiales bacterium]